MATTTRLPDADGITNNWVPLGGGDNFEEVNEGVGAADDGTSEVTEDTNGTDQDHYTMEDVPGDFGTANTVDHRLRAFQSGRVDDATEIILQVVNAAEDTVIVSGDAHDVNAITSYTTLTDSTPPSNSDGATAWDGYRFRLQKAKSASGMPDSVTFFCTAVEVLIDYDIASNDDQEFAATESGPEATVPTKPPIEMMEYGDVG